MQTYTDAEIRRLVTPALTRMAMRDALVAAWNGGLLGTPRRPADLPDRTFSFSAAERPGRWFAHRTFSVGPGPSHDQMVVLQDPQTGTPTTIYAGQQLSPRRSGGIGAAAFEALAPLNPRRIGLVGTGAQAWHQLWALPPWYRDVPVRVFSRRAERRNRFASHAREALHQDVTAVTSAEEAVDGADCVILATSSPRPLLDPLALVGARYVTTLGPNQVRASEFDPEWFHGGWALYTDSPAQVTAYDPPSVLVVSGMASRLTHVGAILSGDRKPPSGPRVFFNVGLSGTDAWLLDEVTGAA